jgi:uncharacterized membrane protein HdeD (DUF308 family)
MLQYALDCWPWLAAFGLLALAFALILACWPTRPKTPFIYTIF